MIFWFSFIFIRKHLLKLQSTSDVEFDENYTIQKSIKFLDSAQIQDNKTRN